MNEELIDYIKAVWIMLVCVGLYTFNDRISALELKEGETNIKKTPIELFEILEKTDRSIDRYIRSIDLERKKSMRNELNNIEQ